MPDHDAHDPLARLEATFRLDPARVVDVLVADANVVKAVRGGLAEQLADTLIAETGDVVAVEGRGGGVDRRAHLQDGSILRIEVKNADHLAYADGTGKVDLRRSSPINGERLYAVGDFDILGVCLAPLTGRWEFTWQAAARLPRKRGDAARLEPNVRIDAGFTPDFAEAVQRARSGHPGGAGELLLF